MPPKNDISEIIRTMPGVNLTGNSTSGQRGNNRQIDIHGMGPENTLILVDGKLVKSRMSVRYGWHGSLNSYINHATHSEEGSTKRTDFVLTGGLTDNLSLRLYGNINKTEADDWDINKKHKINPTSSSAGREGVRNSRQGNIYAGDTQNNNPNDLVSSFYNHETNRMYKDNYALTHRGYWDNGVNTMSYVQVEKTRNSRLPEGKAGGTEGRFNGTHFTTTKYNNIAVHNETNFPLTLVVPQTMIIGGKYNHQKMKDPTSNDQEVSEGGSIPWIKDVNRNTESSANLWSIFVEDNIELTQTTMLTPALRYNHQSESGSNWSPGVNLAQELGDYFTLKLGIAEHISHQIYTKLIRIIYFLAAGKDVGVLEVVFI